MFYFYQTVIQPATSSTTEAHAGHTPMQHPASFHTPLSADAVNMIEMCTLYLEDRMRQMNVEQSELISAEIAKLRESLCTSSSTAFAQGLSSSGSGSSANHYPSFYPDLSTGPHTYHDYLQFVSVFARRAPWDQHPDMSSIADPPFWSQTEPGLDPFFDPTLGNFSDMSACPCTSFNNPSQCLLHGLDNRNDEVYLSVPPTPQLDFDHRSTVDDMELLATPRNTMHCTPSLHPQADIDLVSVHNTRDIFQSNDGPDMSMRDGVSDDLFGASPAPTSYMSEVESACSTSSDAMSEACRMVTSCQSFMHTTPDAVGEDETLLDVGELWTVMSGSYTSELEQLALLY